MSEQKTIVDIRTQYDGSGAARAKADINSLSSTSTAGMKSETAEMDQARQKSDALATSSEKVNKAKIALNATTLTLRGSFREASQQLDKLGGPYKAVAGTLAASVAAIGAVVAIVAALTQKWKEHKAALAEADKQVRELQWQRVQEMLDLKFDKGRKALSDWTDAMQKAEAQAKATAAAILLIETAKNDAEMAKIDMQESNGAITPREAQFQRIELGKRRDTAALDTARSTAESTIETQQGVVYKTSGDINRIEKADAANQAELEAKIEELKSAGIIDDQGASDIRAIAKQGGAAGATQMDRLQKVVEESRQKRVEKQAQLATSMEFGDVQPGDNRALGYRLQKEAEFSKQFETSDAVAIDKAVGAARRAGVSGKDMAEVMPGLRDQQAQARARLTDARSVLSADPLKRQALENRYSTDMLKNTPDSASESLSPDSARDRLLQGMLPAGRRDNTGQVVAGSQQAQFDSLSRLVDQAQSAVRGGADAGVVAGKLVELMNKIGAKFAGDKAAFDSLVDQLDGVINNVKDLKARENNNQAGD